ncbi:MAG: hypothetical protein ACI4KC_09460 [Gemmiger sp.]
MKDLQSEDFIWILDNALSNVSENFWVIARADGSYVIRERAFCYELYHQLRKFQEQYKEDCCEEKRFVGIDITGEIDKRGYSLLQSQDSPNPDFVFHEMGSNAHNEIVMEVKGRIDRRYKKEIIQKDFKNLALFIANDGLRYNFGVLLLYGHNMDELMQIIKEKRCLLRQIIKDCCVGSLFSEEDVCRRIILFTKEKKEVKSQCLYLSDLLDKLDS